MLRLGWTRAELDAADPDDVYRIMWAMDAEMIAMMVERMESARSDIYVPDHGIERAKAQAAQYALQESIDEADAILMPEGDDE